MPFKLGIGFSLSDRQYIMQITTNMLITMENSGEDQGDNVRFGISTLKLQQFQEVIQGRRKAKRIIMEQALVWKVKRIKGQGMDKKNIIMKFCKEDGELTIGKESEPSNSLFRLKIRDGKDRLLQAHTSLRKLQTEIIIEAVLGFKIFATLETPEETQRFVDAIAQYHHEVEAALGDFDPGLPNDDDETDDTWTTSTSGSTSSHPSTFSSGSPSSGSANIPQPANEEAHH